MTNALLKNLSRFQSEALAGEILEILEPASSASGGYRHAEAQPGGPVPALMRSLTELLGPAFSPGAGEDASLALSRLAQALAEAFSSGTDAAGAFRTGDMAEGSPATPAHVPSILSKGQPARAGADFGDSSMNPNLRSAFAARPGSAFEDSAEAGQDLEGFSEYYRRDARRYDSGFAPLL